MYSFIFNLIVEAITVKDLDGLGKASLKLAGRAIFAILIASALTSTPEQVRESAIKLIFIDIFAIYYFEKTRRISGLTYLDIFNEITDYIKNILKVVYREIYWIVEKDIKR